MPCPPERVGSPILLCCGTAILAGHSLPYPAPPPTTLSTPLGRKSSAGICATAARPPLSRGTKTAAVVQLRPSNHRLVLCQRQEAGKSCAPPAGHWGGGRLEAGARPGSVITLWKEPTGEPRRATVTLHCLEEGCGGKGVREKPQEAGRALSWKLENLAW